MAKILLDLTDKKILHALDYNSRVPVSCIAKKLKLSRDVVSYRMKQFLKKNMLLKYHTIIDISKLGYAAHKNFIRFQHMTEKKEAEFIAFVRTHPHVVYFATYDGKFDAVISIWAWNVEALAKTIKEIESTFAGYIAERQMATIIRGEYLMRNYLVPKTAVQRTSFFGSTPQPTQVDATDKKILFELSKDARIPSIEIANALQMSLDAMYKRIKKLTASGVIQSYNLVPNEQCYPYTHYKLLISLYNLRNEKERALHAYCRMHKNIWYFCTCLGPWNFEIDGDFESPEEFRFFLRELKLHFSEVIKDYTVMISYKTHTYNFCPSIPQ